MACLLVRGRGGGEDERRLAFSFSLRKSSPFGQRAGGASIVEKRGERGEEDEKDGRRGWPLLALRISFQGSEQGKNALVSRCATQTNLLTTLQEARWTSMQAAADQLRCALLSGNSKGKRGPSGIAIAPIHPSMMALGSAQNTARFLFPCSVCLKRKRGCKEKKK
jgi:hypothetical protein